MKNYTYIGILMVFVIMATVAVAGCTGSNTSNPTATPAATTTGTAPSTTAATATPAASSGGALSTLSSAFDLTKVHWYEYQMTGGSTTGTTTMREDLGTTYNGQTADKMTMTMNMDQGSTTIVMYMDSKTHDSLGGTMTTVSNGQTFTTAIPASTTSTTSTQSNPLDTNSGATLTNAGPDSVTVPAGTYAATKYTFSVTNGATGSVWVASNVPVPVKYETAASGATMDMVLSGWG